MAEKTTTNYSAMLDKVFIDSLNEPLLKLGQDRYSFSELVALGVGNRAAARNLQEKCKRIGVRSIEHLNAIGAQALLRTAHVGNATMWVAMHVLADRGYSVEQWWGWEAGVTPKFSTYRERARRKAQKRGRHEV